MQGLSEEGLTLASFMDSVGFGRTGGLPPTAARFIVLSLLLLQYGNYVITTFLASFKSIGISVNGSIKLNADCHQSRPAGRSRWACLFLLASLSERK